MENKIFDNVSFDHDVSLGYGNILGIKRRKLSVKFLKKKSEFERDAKITKIGKRVVIMNQTVIYEGVLIEDDSYIDDFVKIGSGTLIGEGSMLLYGAYITENVVIGKNCKISGFIPNNTVVGNNVTMMGKIAHRYNLPLDWSRTEPSPIIRDNVVIGIGAIIVGDVEIGENSYVGANATVTKDVPSNSLVLNTNEIKSLKLF